MDTGSNWMYIVKNRDGLKLANTFIEAKADKMNKDEQNFLYLCISQINTDDKAFKAMKIHIQDIEKLVLVKKNHTQIISFITDLRKKGITYEENGIIKARSFFHRLNYVRGSGVIEAQLHEDLYDMCLKLKQNFTQASLFTCTSFRSKYSTPLYLLLKSIYDKQKQYCEYICVDYAIPYLIEHFQLPKSYNLYNNLKQKFLEITEKDINNNSDFNISFGPVKRGRKLEAIRFTIDKKTQAKSIAFNNFVLKHDTHDLDMRVSCMFDKDSLKAITEMKLNAGKLNELINIFGINAVIEGIYQMSKREHKYIKNKNNYLKAIIKNKSSAT